MSNTSFLAYLVIILVFVVVSKADTNMNCSRETSSSVRSLNIDCDRESGMILKLSYAVDSYCPVIISAIDAEGFLIEKRYYSTNLNKIRGTFESSTAKINHVRLDKRYGCSTGISVNQVVREKTPLS